LKESDERDKANSETLISDWARQRGGLQCHGTCFAAEPSCRLERRSLPRQEEAAGHRRCAHRLPADSVSHALATIERLGRDTGIFVTYTRTDTQLITKGEIYGTGKYAAPPAGTRRVNAKNLDYFDAIFFLGLGEHDLSPQQKSDLLSFVHDDGKGFTGAHSAIDAFYNWPEYGEMMGAYLAQQSKYRR
jgi:hypothetical protein